jgi:hypothetical protein
MDVPASTANLAGEQSEEDEAVLVVENDRGSRDAP